MKYLTTHLLIACFIFQSYFLLFRFSSCTRSSRTSENIQTISNLYKAQPNDLHPQYTVFHRSGTTSELYFKINSKELLYSKQPGDEKFSARFSINYKLISSYETKDIIDSATLFMSDPFSSSVKDITGKIDITATLTNSYVLRVLLMDLNRNSISDTYIPINKLDQYSRQNFIVLTAKNKIPIFNNYLRKGEKVYIKYRTPGELLYVRYYHRSFPLPAPPFSNGNVTPFEYHADSTFTFMPNENDTSGIQFNPPGFYHILADTNTKEGLTIYRFNDGFPDVKTETDLLDPLRYLTTRQEFAAMQSAKNIKTAVDSFWVTAGGSRDRARELIRKYYNRVENSNQYFSSYVEGWKTDRGLLYIIYGAPNVVYKSSNSETWVYGEESNYNSLSFTFLKVINPFTDNDYRLQRNPSFKTSWMNAVDMWRQGRVYAEK